MSNFCRNLDAALVSGVRKTHGRRSVLEGVSLRVARGEGVALWGPNGAGKTTFLSLLAGIARPDAGTVQVFGVSPERAEGRRALGFVPQDLALYPELTGAENVALFGRLLGLRGANLRAGVRAALAAVDLATMANLRASAYSGGMCRRLSVACALVHGPELLLLDEPFVGLDTCARAQLLAELVSRKRKGMTIVLSTHTREEALALCDRMVSMAHGRVVGEERLVSAEPPWARASSRVGRSALGAG